MKARLLQLPLAVLLALGAAAGVHAQSGVQPRSEATLLPVWNSSGKLEAVLQLEPSATPAAGARWRTGSSSLDAVFGVATGDTLGLVCDRKTGLAQAIGNLANHCMLATLEGDAGSRQLGIGASVTRGGNRLGVLLGNARDTLPAWLTPNSKASRIDENSLTVFGQKNIGREATVSIGGTLAKARLIPADAIPSEMADQWTIKTVTVGAEKGNFGANIIGRVVDTPGLPGQWGGLGVGLTWRTPWSGQLTVGAENVVTRGKNPFAPGNGDKEEGTVPYVRYEQDL